MPSDGVSGRWEPGAGNAVLKYGSGGAEQLRRGQDRTRAND